MDPADTGFGEARGDWVGEEGPPGELLVELKNGLSENLDAEFRCVGCKGGGPKCDAAGDWGTSVGNTDFPHRLHPISAAAVVMLARMVDEETGSITSSPLTMAEVTPLLLNQLRSGAASNRKVGSWSSATALARKGCVKRLVTRGAKKIALDASLSGRDERRCWIKAMYSIKGTWEDRKRRGIASVELACVVAGASERDWRWNCISLTADSAAARFSSVLLSLSSASSRPIRS